MDFFASQELARRNTRRLVVYYILAVICIVIAIYFVVLFAMEASNVQRNRGMSFEWLQPGLLLAVAGGKGLFIDGRPAAAVDVGAASCSEEQGRDRGGKEKTTR